MDSDTKSIYLLSTRKVWENGCQANRIKKQAGIAILISDKTYFKQILIRRDKEEHFILNKRSTTQENITVLNIYALNSSEPSFIKKNTDGIKDMGYYKPINSR